MGFALCDMELKSTAFAPGGTIPIKYTGEGSDVSPALAWSNPPHATQSYAVVCHDPDAPLLTQQGYGFVHWVLYGIPNEVTSIDEATAKYVQGTNDFGKTGYGGPMPPVGHGTHNYYFWILALDTNRDLPANLSMLALFEQIEPHCIGMNRLIGTYQRS